MLHDVEFLTTKLGKLDGFAETDQHLKKIINAKQVKAEEPAAVETKKEEEEGEEEKTKEAESAPAAEAGKEEEKK